MCSLSELNVLQNALDTAIPQTDKESYKQLSQVTVTMSKVSHQTQKTDFSSRGPWLSWAPDPGSAVTSLVTWRLASDALPGVGLGEGRSIRIIENGAVCKLRLYLINETTICAKMFLSE